jgi:hypothetical protein
VNGAGVKSNYRVNPPVGPFTAVACATAAPVPLAGYAARWTDTKKISRGRKGRDLSWRARRPGSSPCLD